jgi:hypothetical protein
VTAVSGNFFDELGVPMLLGRGFTPDEDRVPGRDAVTVLSYGLWQQLFNGDPHVVGREMWIGNHSFTVVGVTDKSYTGMYQRDIPNESFVPLAMEREVFRIADATRAPIVGSGRRRSKPGCGQMSRWMKRARRCGSLRASWRAPTPATNTNQDIIVQTEFQARVSSGELEAGVLLILNILAVAVLCVACANVAGLLTSRRRCDTASSPSASPSVLGVGVWLPSLLTESLLLAILGGLGGIAVGEAGIRLLQRIDLTTDLIGPPVFVMDNRALGFSHRRGDGQRADVRAGAGVEHHEGGPVVLDARDRSGHAAGDGGPGGAGGTPDGAAGGRSPLMLLTVAAITYQTFAETFGRGPGFRTTNIAKISVDARAAWLRGAHARRSSSTGS